MIHLMKFTPMLTIIRLLLFCVTVILGLLPSLAMAHIIFGDDQCQIVLKQFLPQAKKGSPVHQMMVGALFIRPSWVGDCEWDAHKRARLQHEGIEWHKKAAAQGFTPAMVELGDAYSKDYYQSITQDFAASTHWYKKAAKGNDAEGQYKYALSLLNGIGTDKEPLQALHWLRLSASQGYAPALNVLAQQYDNGINVVQNPQRAIDLWKVAARQYNEEAANHLIKAKAIILTEEEAVIAKTHPIGFGPPYSSASAFFGCPSAQASIASCFEHAPRCQGIMDIDLEKAKQWDIRAAESGSFLSQETLFNQFLKTNPEEACYYGTLVGLTKPDFPFVSKYSLYQAEENKKYWDSRYAHVSEQVQNLKGNMSQEALQACDNRITNWKLSHTKPTEAYLHALIWEE